MSQFITVKKTDSDFKKYLWGTFSKEQRAISTQSLNVNTESELVTFKILNLSEVAPISFFRKWSSILKLDRLIFVLLPLFLVLFQTLQIADIVDLSIAALSTIGLLCLHFAAMIRNEYKDYIIGIDRIFKSDSKVLMNGWSTSQQMRGWALMFAAFGALCGLPAVLTYPEILLFLSILAVVAGILYSSPGWGSKNKPLGEFSVFLVYGPMLAVGYQFALVGGYNLEVIMTGIVIGMMTLFLIHLRNFEQILAFSQAQIRSSVTLFGFEKTKKFLAFWWITLALFFVFDQWFFERSVSFILSLVFIPWMTFGFLRNLFKIEACVGSRLTTLKLKGQKIYHMLAFIWILGTLADYFDLVSWML